MIGFTRGRLKVALATVAMMAAQPALAPALSPAWAQGDYPSRPIRLIVGFAAGGGNDLFARLVGQKMSELLGQTVVIENKAGAGGRLAIDFVKGQPADGYTITVAASGQMAIAAAIYPKLGYHPTRDFVPLTMIASFPLILAGPMDDSIKSVKDLVAYSKAHPEKSNYATSSPAFTITTELFKLKTGMPGQMIPYKSTNEMMLSIAAGQTLFGFADPPIVIPLAQGGKVRALAMTGPSRLPELPDVPTVAEAGFGNIEIRLQWIGAFATAGTPPATVRMLEAAMRQVLADPAVRDKLKAVAYAPDGRSGEEFRRLIDADIKAYADVVRAANLKFD